MTQYSGKVIRKTPVTPTQTSASGVWKQNEVAAAVQTNTWPIAGVPNPISRSVRLRSSASAYLNRTFGTPTNNLKYTFSGWVKRGKLGVAQTILGGASAGTGQFPLYFTASDTLGFYESDGVSTYYNIGTSSVFRDPAAWYHIVMVFDSANATQANRLIIYVNGVSQTLSSIGGSPGGLLPLNRPSYFNASGAADNIGCYYLSSTANNPLDGYLTEINFIDGQALTPSSFGTTDSLTGVWIPMPYTGTYGTNGFYLNFKDNTDTTTIGYDYSGNSNNWTANNISLTAGTTYDSMLDVPTLWQGYNTGDPNTATRGNYCVWNPLTGTNGTTSEGNLYFYGPSSYASRIGTMSLPASSKIYFEFTYTVAPFSPRGTTTGYNWVGVGLTTNFNVQLTPAANQVNGLMLGDNGYLNNFASSASDTGFSFALNDVVGFAIDTGANTYTIYKNNSSIATGTMGVTAGTSLSPMQVSYDASYGAPKINFGQRPFSYTPPTGFKSLCTTNLPAPTITNGANYMAATLYTGNGSSQSISNGANNTLGRTFYTDFLWQKARSSATDNIVYDTNRGSNYLVTNSTAADVSSGIIALTSTGFNAGSGSAVNSNTVTYVAWMWNAGSGTTVSNTSGSITSTVSANTTAGFSVVTYTGTGATGTVGHGLGVAPSMIIFKERSGGASSGVNDWGVYHVSTGNTGQLRLDLTAAFVANSTCFNNTSPTSSVFTIGSQQNFNESSGAYVAYCWAAVAGYSAFGSYTGNGSTDGPFVYCGFRPRWILFKDSTNAATNWVLQDTSRFTYNLVTGALLANTSASEYSTGYDVDILSNGFKLRRSGGDTNASSATIIYAAFAENPFRISNAR